VHIERVSFVNRRGGTIGAWLLRGDAADGVPHPGVVLQHDIGNRGEDLMGDACRLAGAGAVVLLPDWALDAGGCPSDDTELWRCATDDLRRAFDLLAARADVDAGELGFVGFGFGASAGALLAATDARVRALALVDPEGDPRAGSYSSLRWRWNLERFDAPAPSESLRHAEAHAPVLLQLGTRERALSDEDLAQWIGAANGQDVEKWYATTHAPEALQDRLSFLISHVVPARRSRDP
jgi:dienelactone hydrolase